MCRIISLIIISSYVLTISAQDSIVPVKSNWKHAFQTGANINQSTFSNNWKGGGVNSFAFGTFLSLLSTKTYDKWSMNSDLQLQLGFIENKGQVRIKSADRIFYDFKAGYKISPKWDFFGSVNFLSQFMDGVDNSKKDINGKDSSLIISTFMAPAYLTSSLGLEYKPVSYFWARFGIGTLRQTFVLDTALSNQKLYGLENAGDKLRNQIIVQLIANFDKNLMENVNLKCRYTLNVDYLNLDKDYAFVNLFNANLTMKVNKFISTNLQMQLIRDFNQDPKTQFAQVLAIGILYNWKNFEK